MVDVPGVRGRQDEAVEAVRVDRDVLVHWEYHAGVGGAAASFGPACMGRLAANKNTMPGEGDAHDRDRKDGRAGRGQR